MHVCNVYVYVHVYVHIVCVGVHVFVHVGSLAISSGRAVVQQNKLMQTRNCIGYFQALTPKRL